MDPNNYSLLPFIFTKLSSKNTIELLLKSNILLYLSYYKECSDLLNEIVEPSLQFQGIIYKCKGMIYEMRNQYEIAINYYEQASKIFQNDARLWFDLATIFKIINNDKEACKCYEKAAYFCNFYDNIARYFMKPLSTIKNATIKSGT